MGRFLRLLSMARLLLAQDALLPPDFFTDAPRRVRLARRLFTLFAPRFREDNRGRKLSDRIRKLGPTYISSANSSPRGLILSAPPWRMI